MEAQAKANGLVHVVAAARPTEAAVVWRAKFEAVVQGQQDYSALRAEIRRGAMEGLWRQFRSVTGEPFYNFKDFCEAARPHGLGVDHAIVNALLFKELGERGARLAMASAPHQGKRVPSSATSGHDDRKSERTVRRDRTIGYAPEAIRKAYTLKLLGVAEANKLGSLAHSGTDTQKQQVAAYAQQLDKLLQRPDILKRKDVKKSVQKQVRNFVVTVQNQRAANTQRVTSAKKKSRGRMTGKPRVVEAMTVKGDEERKLEVDQNTRVLRWAITAVRVNGVSVTPTTVEVDITILE